MHVDVVRHMMGYLWVHQDKRSERKKIHVISRMVRNAIDLCANFAYHHQQLSNVFFYISFSLTLYQPIMRNNNNNLAMAILQMSMGNDENTLNIL
ncbi:CLUMA_CG013885, isoform A [Clunio marinus]|uniref:CLUMA_CG013885, isoform A n=1 Tax=Clunio marinus TaxID=568069 RepID=A0A1J1IQ44_9DIPT|nr:CLUMA_CG013885, isoform A [Clunio marinus]